MRLKPNTRNDEKLFLAIIEFMTKLFDYQGFESVIKDLISEGNLFIKFIKTIENFESGKMKCMTHKVLITAT